MSLYRPGDRTVDVAGVPTRLRLSVAALAEIADALEADTPKALADILRHATPAQWNCVLAAISEPRPARPLDKAELSRLLPIISAVIVAGLTP